jgi:hypothetical protein
MIKINTKLFDLNDVYTNMTHSEAWLMSINLMDIKFDLEESKHDLITCGGLGVDSVSDIIAIDQQLWFVEQNMKTLEDALLCFETKIFEHRMMLKDLKTVCLN